MECKWIGTFGSPTGYSKLNREVVRELLRQHVDIGIKICDIDKIKKENIFRSISDLKALSTDRAFSLNVFSKIYTEHVSMDRSKINVLFTMNESNNLLNYDVERAKKFDEIWVPSEFCVKTYNSKGFKNVQKIPLGVNESLYKENKLKFMKNKFTFLSVFSWSFRKGYDALLKSYYNAFSKDDNVELIIITKVLGIQSEEGTNHILKSINDIKKKYKKTLPKIKLILHDISEKQLIDFYQNSDCFVLPSRGEGFCLPLLEAGFCKLPIISTNYSGHLDYLNKENSTLVDIDGFSTVGDDKFFSSSYHNTLEFPTLGDDFVHELSQKMKNIYLDKTENLKKSEILWENINNVFTWKKTAENIKNRLIKY